MATTGRTAAARASGTRAGSAANGSASPEERAASGKACRSQTPRSSHAAWDPPADRPDPIALLEEQSAGRLQDLVPLRYGRMAASPFAFHRGAAYVMASDLAGTARTGIRVQLCGDAHIANFGGFASPERELLFDLVDFDETLPGPWEWDLKRLAASVAIAGRDNGFSAAARVAMVREAVKAYREAMSAFAPMKTLEVWYARMSVSDLEELMREQASRSEAKRFDKTVEKGARKDNARAYAKLTVEENGDVRIRADPPLIVPISDLVDSDGRQTLELEARRMLNSRSYLSSLPRDRRKLLARYRYTDLARKVVGVGSVGLRCWVILLLGRDSGDALFLQAKEAPRSSLERFAGKSEFSNQGQRVVEGQRLMQAASDIFLGWMRELIGLDEVKPRDLYLRQMWDSKISPDVAAMQASEMQGYARACAWTLARAHARSADPIPIAGYLGSSDVFDRAIADFAEAYADQNERDHAALLEAIDSGRVQAQTEA